MKRVKWQELNIKVGGNSIKVIQGAQSEDVKFLEKLDSKFNEFNDVFKCLSKVDKSINPDWKKQIIIFLQCPRFCLNKKFCQTVISGMETEIAEEMELETRIDKTGFVNFG